MTVSEVPLMSLRAVLMWVCPKCRLAQRADLTQKAPKCLRCLTEAQKEEAKQAVKGGRA